MIIFRRRHAIINDENLQNYASKKYNKHIFTQRIIYTFNKCFQKNFRTHSRNDFDFQSLGIEIQQINKIFMIWMHFYCNLMIFVIRNANVNNKNLWNHASKKYEKNILTQRIAHTFEKCFHKTFMTHSHNDFDLQSQGIGIQQNNKLFGILTHLYCIFGIFSIRSVIINNMNLWNHACKKYEKYTLEKRITNTFKKYFQQKFMTHSRNYFDFES